MNEIPFIEPIVSKFRYSDKKTLMEAIEKNASPDQTKTTVDLGKAYADVYQPYLLGSLDFDQLHKELTVWFQENFKKNIWVCKDLWAVHYRKNAPTTPHSHASHYSAVWYPVAEEDCGPIEFNNPDLIVQPEEDTIVVFHGLHVHSVLPGLSDTAKRTCIAINLFDTTINLLEDSYYKQAKEVALACGMPAEYFDYED